jgi:hypothetical protein
MASVFWVKNGIRLVDCYHRGKALLAKSRQRQDSKPGGKLPRGILFLQDNAAPHKAAIRYQQSADLHSTVLKYPAYWPGVASSDYCLLHNLKEYLKGRKFSGTEEVTLAGDGRFAAHAKGLFLAGVQKLEQCSHTCLELSG